MRRVEIGNSRGKIALLLDESDAVDLANTFGPSDGAWKELMDAVEKAYPPLPCEECDGLGHYTTWPHTSCPTCNGTGRAS